MIANTLSSLSRVMVQPVYTGGHPVSSPSLNTQNPIESHLSSLKPIESLVETNKTLSDTDNDSILNSPKGTSGDSDDVKSRQAEERAREDKTEKQVLAQEQKEISQLASRDREVRAHEQAHAAIGGQYAGAPTYTFQSGPDGVRYAVGGEVSIDVSKGATPEETIRKAQVVRQAALAPAEPSPQDRRVAAEASQIQMEAVQELRAQSSEESAQARESNSEKANDEDKNTSISNDTKNVNEEKSSSSFTTNFADNMIGSRTYQSIARIDIINNHNGDSLLDQIV